MRILVTGASGFVGNAVAKELRDRGALVISTGLRDQENGTVGVHAGYDFSNLDWQAVGPVDAVVHQAACTDTTVLDLSQQLQTNYHDTATLFRQAVRHGVKQIVYASSCAVYGDQDGPFTEDMEPLPLNPYAISKACLDQFAQQFAEETGVTIIGLRYSNVFGKGEQHKGHAASMVSRIRWQMKEGHKPRLFKHGEQRRDWVYIKDVVQANLKALEAKASGAYNIASGHSTSFNDIVKHYNTLTGWSMAPEYIDNPHAGRYQSVTEVSIEKAKKVLGYVPQWAFTEALTDYNDGETYEELFAGVL